MAVFTKGFIATDHKDVLEVATLAEAALTRLITDRRSVAYPGVWFFTPEKREEFQMPNIRLSPEMGTLHIEFACDGEQRNMSLNFECDVDNQAFAPKSLSLMMGCSGNSELYVKTVLASLSVFGPAFFDACDSDDVPMAPLDAPRPTLIELLATDRLSGYVFERAIEKAPSRATVAFEDFVGCTHTQAHQFDAIKDPGKRWDAMRAFANSCVQERDEDVSPVRVRKAKP